MKDSRHNSPSPHDLVSRLSGGIAHDLNNLLTVIGGFAEVALQRAGEDLILARHLGSVRQACLQGAVLTNQLLGYTKGFMSEPKELTLQALVEGMRKPVFWILGEEGNHAIEVPQAGPTVRVRELRVQAVVLNALFQLNRLPHPIDRISIRFSHGPSALQPLEIRISVAGQAPAETATPFDSLEELARWGNFTFSWVPGPSKGTGLELHLVGGRP